MLGQIKDRSFQLWEYRVSHGCLLIRSPNTSEQGFNIDIKFYGVEFISAPRHLKKIVISEPRREEIQYLGRLLNKPVEKDNVFVLESPNGRYLIVAAKMIIDKNQMDMFETPFV